MNTVFTWISQEPALAAGLAAIAILFINNYLSEGREKARIQSGVEGARLQVYNKVIVHLWLLTAVTAGVWLMSGRDAGSLGLGLDVDGWRSWLAWGLTAAGAMYFIWTVMTMAFSAKSRDSIRKQIGDAGDLDLIRPENEAEYRRFHWVALTAGITEEIIFRGFLIGVFALWMPVPAAAALAVVIFILGHAYQGVAGMLRIVPISIGLTLVFLLSGSLWPGIILHALADLVGGAVFQILNANEEEDQAAAATA
ncbi:CPBP family intramembrane glutamic endopeptidase [Maricaulis sp. MIT060901]|uniref:CPBP family intramembrane glutamic endopeptidase n=1 Tax=Maricaulis sp. MIT060901 TaxID=3096993 RepID=UPI00399AE6B7